MKEITPDVGQIWRDEDERSREQEFLIIGIKRRGVMKYLDADAEEYVVSKNYDMENEDYVFVKRGDRRLKILYRRLVAPAGKNTGYTYIGRSR